MPEVVLVLDFEIVKVGAVCAGATISTLAGGLTEEEGRSLLGLHVGWLGRQDAHRGVKGFLEKLEVSFEFRTKRVICTCGDELGRGAATGQGIGICGAFHTAVEVGHSGPDTARQLVQRHGLGRLESGSG